MVLGLELDDGFKHLHRRRIGGSLGAPGLAVDAGDFGHSLDQPVSLLQQLARFSSRQPRQRRRHVEQIALVQARHELAANVLQRPQAEHQHDAGSQQGEFGRAQHHFQHGPVDRDQQTVQRIGFFVGNPAPDEVTHQHRYQGDRQPGRCRHGIGLGKSQRREHPAFLGFKGEHRDKRQGDDEQRKEQRRPHFRCRVADDAPARLALQGFIRMVATPMLQVFVGVFDHDHRRIDHGANGNRDAAQRHDVRVHPLVAHHDEGDQNTQRQRDDGHEGRAQVK